MFQCELQKGTLKSTIELHHPTQTGKITKKKSLIYNTKTRNQLKPEGIIFEQHQNAYIKKGFQYNRGGMG